MGKKPKKKRTASGGKRSSSGQEISDREKFEIILQKFLKYPIQVRFSEKKEEK